jgi:hypothetical protein
MARSVGRPQIEIDWTEFDKLCEIQCTLREISEWFKCSEDTIERAVQRKHGVNFAEYYGQSSVKGKISLRRKQFQVAMSGDRTLLIWLGKQLLNQTEKQHLVTIDETDKHKSEELTQSIKTTLNSILKEQK